MSRCLPWLTGAMRWIGGLLRLSHLSSGFRAKARRRGRGTALAPGLATTMDHGRAIRAPVPAVAIPAPSPGPSPVAPPHQNRRIPPAPVPARWPGRAAKFNECDALMILFIRASHSWNRGGPGDGAGGERGTGGNAVAGAGLGTGPVRVAEARTGLGPRGLAWDQSCDSLYWVPDQPTQARPAAVNRGILELACRLPAARGACDTRRTGVTLAT